jgi:WD40 repeat protein
MKIRALFLALFLLIASVQVQAQDDLQVITADNAAQLQELTRYGDGQFTSALAWSPDGNTLAVGGTLGVWLYDVQDWNTLPQFIDLDQAVQFVVFSPDGSLLAILTAEMVHLWDIEAENTRTMLPAQTGAVAFSPDSSRLVVGTTALDPSFDIPAPMSGPVYTATITVYDLQTLEIETTYLFEDDLWDTAIQRLWFTGDNTIVAIYAAYQGTYACEDSFPTGIVWAVDDRTFDTLYTQDYQPYGLANEVVGAVNHDGTMLVLPTRDEDTLAVMLDTETWNSDEIARTSDVTGYALSYSLSEIHQRLAVNMRIEAREPEYHYEYSTLVVEVDSGDVVASLNETYTSSLTFNPDESLLAGVDGTTVHIWETNNYTEQASLQSEAVRFDETGTGFSFGNEYIPFTQEENNAVCVDNENGDPVCTVVNPAGNEIVYEEGLRGANGNVVFQLPDQTSQLPIFDLGGNDVVGNITFSSDAARVAFGVSGWCHCGCGSTYQVQIWDVSGDVGDAVQIANAYTPHIGGLWFNPDDTLLVIATGSGIEILDAQAGSILTQVDLYITQSVYGRHPGSMRYISAVRRVAFSLEGTRLFTEGSDGTVRVWGVPAQD